MRPGPATAALFVSFTLAALTATAASRAGVEMPDTINVAGKSLVLNGLGVREATMFKVDVYVAGLYVTTKSKDPAAILAQPGPRRIVLKFVRDVDRSDLTGAWSDGFEHTGDKAMRPRVKQLNSYMTDAKTGGSMSFTWVPEKGTEIVVDNKSKGTVPGADFAKALFEIWLGTKPPNSGLKTGMLGR